MFVGCLDPVSMCVPQNDAVPLADDDDDDVQLVAEMDLDEVLEVRCRSCSCCFEDIPATS